MFFIYKDNFNDELSPDNLHGGGVGVTHWSLIRMFFCPQTICTEEKDECEGEMVAGAGLYCRFFIHNHHQHRHHNHHYHHENTHQS